MIGSMVLASVIYLVSVWAKAVTRVFLVSLANEMPVCKPLPPMSSRLSFSRTEHLTSRHMLAKVSCGHGI